MSEFNFQVKDQVPDDVKANYSNDGVRYTSRLYSSPPYGGTRRTKCLVMRKLEWLGYHMLKTWWYAKPFRHDSGTWQTDRQTDGRTDGHNFCISIARQHCCADERYQEAQLSQWDCAMLCVIEYFTKSLRITEGHSKWRPWVWRVEVSSSVSLWLFTFSLLVINSSTLYPVTVRAKKNLGAGPRTPSEHCVVRRNNK